MKVLRIASPLGLAAALALAGCGSSTSASKQPPSAADVQAVRSALVDVTQQCVQGIEAMMPNSNSTGPDVSALSRDVTTLVSIYKRGDPNAKIQSSGATTVRQYIDSTISMLDKPTSEPSMGQRLASQTP
jgi:hypothetical protein